VLAGLGRWTAGERKEREKSRPGKGKRNGLLESFRPKRVCIFWNFFFFFKFESNSKLIQI
jgi:hypothetical protein